MSKGAFDDLDKESWRQSCFVENGYVLIQIKPGWVLTEKEILNKKEQGMKADW